MSYRHNKGFSRKQQADYRPIVKAAWLAHCLKRGLFPNERGAQDAWYRDELMACIGENTTSRCNTSTDFDIVVRHFAIIAGNEYWPTRVADNPERQMRHYIGQRLDQLGKIDGGHYSWNYAIGILRHMFPGSPLAATMEDCPAKILRKVFIALDRHVARTRAKAAHVEQNKEVPF